MPPKKGIVKSGNSGNSSKASKSNAPAPAPTDKPPSLFPPGYKTPLSLLYERCQQLGWNKPNVETKPYKEGFTAIITLAKDIKNSPNKETVRMLPQPPLIMPSAMEAKHWGAVYALHRFGNNLQLHRTLPPGPRDYWAQLEEEKKKAPEHLAWQYAEDPFQAQREVKERQEAALQRRKKKEAGPTEQEIDLAMGHIPEVRMASAVRDMVENVIKEMAAQYPGVVEEEESASIDRDVLERQLETLGFKDHQINKALAFLTQSTTNPSPYLSSLLSLPPLDACLSYLLVHIPETDLPPQFLTQQRASEAFVRTGGINTLPISARWMAERAIKEGGWPEKNVADIMAKLMASRGADWSLLNEQLNYQLSGTPEEDIHREMSEEQDDRDARRSEEIDALTAVYPSVTVSSPDANDGDNGESADHIVLHIILSPSHPYPSPSCRHPPMYVSAPTQPPYVRLHLLASILNELQASAEGELFGLLEAGEGIIFTAIPLLENAWAQIQETGPPEVSDVMRHLLPKQPRVMKPSNQAARPARRDRRAERRAPLGDDRDDATVKRDFETMRRSDAYKKMLDTRMRLPAWNAQDDIISLMRKSRVLLCVGETGCGKTTQLPQFVLDACIEAGQGARTNIVITQPRRVSAISVAARVSSERTDDGSVGYAIRGESKQTRRTKLLFCTTGVLLRRLTLSGSEGLTGVSHIIVDEVHERSVDSDFLLLELRELLKTNKDIKIVLMSATINQKTFVDYFGGAPVIEIPGFTHPVEDLYIEDVISKLKYSPPTLRGAPKVSEEKLMATRESYRSKGLDSNAIRALEVIARSDRTDYQLVSEVVSHIVRTADDPKGAILIFLPGVQEIRQCIDIVRSSNVGSEVQVFPLHANLTSEEQRIVFLPTNKRKVVVATNVAETSITIPDVVYVIDSGKVKEIGFDPSIGISKLEEGWVTKAAARQRRGRAGRVRPGTCFKLYTRSQESTMGNFPVPEILRVPLESLSLQIKVMREDEDVAAFLGKAIDPPKVQAIEKALTTLDELGATDFDGKLTALGRQMALLPVDLRLGKMMILGAIFRCLDSVLTIAACLSSKPLFLNPPDKRDEAGKARARFALANSDLLTDMNAFNQVRGVSGKGAMRNFMEDNFISASSVRDITSLRQDFFSALSDIGFVPLSAKATDPKLNVNNDNTNLVKAIIFGGLWPRIARVALPKATFDQVAAGTVLRDHVAKELKIYLQDQGRVFLHPSSTLFGVASYKSPFLTYFAMSTTSKTFLRDATEIPVYALLFFSSHLTIDHIRGGIGLRHGWIHLRAWARIGVLVTQLRHLLDAQLNESIEHAQIADLGENNPVLQTMLALITHDGLSP
ncbi:P-loop containing nucleoside triphosphate hydrolase protein [Clavulina sp. PMI_390]|nr:P-loop containing nucleoside triphosphate hydrolase protein [Clavulina sp. PMI_390]